MSISLEDVSFLPKIPVTGKVVAVENFARYTEESRSDAIKMVSKLLGVCIEEAEEEVNISKGLTVRKCWLKSRWCPKAGSRNTNYPPVECTARAYLLYLLSCTLFADKSGSRVSIALLKLLEDLDGVGKYAWGAAALAYLYRHLGSATRVQVSQIAGYLTLLEGWVYDHFKLGLATLNAKYMDYVQPRVCRWIQKHETVMNIDKVGSIRRTLDRLRPSEIIDIQQQCLYKTLRIGHTSICSSVQFVPWRPWEVITGGLDSKLILWDFSRGRPCKVMDFGLSEVDSQSNAGQCFNPAFVHALAVPEVDMLDNSGKVCSVARGDGIVDVINVELELAAVKSKGPVKPQKRLESAAVNKLNAGSAPHADIKEKRIRLDYSLGRAQWNLFRSFSLFGERGKLIASGGNDASVKLWDYSKYLNPGESSSSSDRSVLRQNINLKKKVNWLCTTPTDSENLVVCDTSKVVKVYTVA
ncbi:hypothetical protein Syun_027920 [Stephania yunnanensis]|uniref:Aminotransferase-like plant mobile domain-containing protein n=1 Tax=Stephania yunnanensis TaxID=152371 RepID=A0AAP0EQC2_9MAGN